MVTDVKTHYLQHKSGELHESDRSSFEKSALLYSENTSGTSSKNPVKNPHSSVSSYDVCIFRECDSVDP